MLKDFWHASSLLFTLPHATSVLVSPRFIHAPRSNNIPAPTPAIKARDYPIIHVNFSQPSLCSNSALQFSTRTAIPIGQFQVLEDQKVGWGPVGSIWNFTLSQGVTFDSLTANCQGSACIGITGNTEGNGKIQKPSNPTWQVNVTSGMAPSVDVMGITKGGNCSNLQLSITSIPPCALPVAQNCSNKKFGPSADQWAAYSVDKWLASYTSSKDVNDVAELFNSLARDCLDTTEADKMLCAPDSQGYSCDPPAGADLVLGCDSQGTTPGLLAIWGVTRLSNTLHFLYNVFGSVETDVLAWVEQLVDTFVKPTVTAKWEAIVTAASSIVGVLVFCFIFIDAATLGSLSTFLVGVVVGVTNAIAAAANFANGFNTQAPDDTYLKYTAWQPEDDKKFGQKALTTLFGGGSWVAVPNPLNITGLGAIVEDFFATFFIQFVPYGEVTDFQDYYNRNPGKTQFAKGNCTDHRVNDPRRPNYISYGGEEGMTVLTQPYSDYKAAAFKEDQINYEFKVDNVLQSSLDGTALHGFNYNLSTAHFQDLVNNGAAKISQDFAAFPPTTAGLYNFDVCRLTEMSFVGGVQQYGKSIHKGGASTKYIYINADPCSCSTFKDRNGTPFTDAATINVTQAITIYPETGENCTMRVWPANAKNT